MTIDKAIKILKAEEEGWRPYSRGLFHDAIKLGIEALKRIVYLRKDMDCPHWMTLPGETKD